MAERFLRLFQPKNLRNKDGDPLKDRDFLMESRTHVFPCISLLNMNQIDSVNNQVINDDVSVL